jgi:hypothetical protein
MPAPFAVRATGRWESGGVIELWRAGALLNVLDPGRLPWAVVALLMRSGIDSAEHGWARAFLTIKELKRSLKQHADYVSDPQRIIRSVYNVRKEIRHIAFTGDWERSTGTACDWGQRFIESTPLGYRISMPPGCLDLEVLDE